jgi:hypothetical protein
MGFREGGEFAPGGRSELPIRFAGELAEGALSSGAQHVPKRSFNGLCGASFFGSVAFGLTLVSHEMPFVGSLALALLTQCQGFFV